MDSQGVGVRCGGRVRKSGRGFARWYLAMRPVGLFRMAPRFAAGESSRTQLTPPPIDGVRVLIVDDEPDGCAAMAYALEDYGARVTIVASAREAMQAIECDVPDVLLSDLVMPGEDGYALIRKVRALAPDRGGPVPAAALTARSEDKVRALRAGFQLHLAKPLSPPDVAAAVAALAGRKEDDPAVRRAA